jgi:hypothetical protein
MGRRYSSGVQQRRRLQVTVRCSIRLGARSDDTYVGSDSPLGEVLAIHADFFNLFEDFRGYVEHFLLQDLVGGDFASVRFLKDFDDFSVNALPDASVEEYREYMRRSMAFIEARNRRIAAYATRLTRPAGEPRAACAVYCSDR